MNCHSTSHGTRVTQTHRYKTAILSVAMASLALPAVADTLRFEYTGLLQEWTVPADVTSLTLSLWGAGGGGYNPVSPGAAGAYVTGDLAVTPGSVLTFAVGRGGVPAVSQIGGAAGGLGGGGAGGNGGDGAPAYGFAGALDPGLGGASGGRFYQAGQNGGIVISYTFSPVPEPATNAAVLGVAVAGRALWRRRR
jgi:hypothetical protein